MKITQLLEESLMDYEGKIAPIIFFSGCNFACPSCHARKILKAESFIDEKEIFDYLNSRKGWIDGIVLCGGEPTLQHGLEQFCEKIKEKQGKDFCIKLDTNGSNPQVLKNLLEKKLVNYLALDVKASKELYNQVVGVDVETAKIEQSMNLALEFPDYEYRTTIVPVVRANEIIFLTIEELKQMAKWVYSITGKKAKWYLQKFVARNKEEMLDERLSKERLAREMHETPQDLLKQMQIAINAYADVRVR